MPDEPQPVTTLPYGDERWVRRLRDGEAPPRWRLVLGSVGVSVVGALLLWAEVLHPGWVRDVWDDGGRGGILVFVPPVLLLIGPVAAVMASSTGRRDRRILAHVRAAGPAPAFHLPVLTTSLRPTDELPDPKPEMWTVDAEGLHGWVPDVARPVNLLPWSRVHRIDLATRRERGMDVDYAIWVDTANGHLVLTPRAAIGRPLEAAATKLDVLMRVLRALRPAAAPDDSE